MKIQLINSFVDKTVEKHSSQKDYATGFGGKFGVQSDRVDKSAVGWDHIEKVEKHESQKDYSHGFGGKFGVQEDRKDASAVGWDYVEKPQHHESQVDHKIVCRKMSHICLFIYNSITHLSSHMAT